MMSTESLIAVSNHVWQSTLILVLAWMLALVLRKQRARVRYAVWLIASVKFLVPFSLLIVAGAALHSRRVAQMPVAGVSQAIEHVTVPVSEEQGSGIALGDGTVAIQRVRFDRLSELLVLVWLTGVLTLSAAWFAQWLHLRSAVRRAMPVGLFHGVPVRMSSSLMEPGVFGFLRPVLVLPRGLESKLTALQRESVLLHEVSHARRYDNLTAALHMLVQALFWFHPGVWWLKACLLEERERACDEAVLDAQPDADAYAKGILGVCRFYTESPLVCSAGITGSDLRRRIDHIVSGGTKVDMRPWHKLSLGGVALLVIGIPFGVGVTRVQAASVVGMEEAQAAALTGDKQEFDVASVRLNKDGVTAQSPVYTNVDLDPGDIFVPTHGVFALRNKSLRTLIAFAYKMSGDQQNFLKHNVPDFVLSERFDIQARTLNQDATKDDYRAMMRSLLEERFRLKVHNETREGKVYVLLQATPGKLGRTLRVHPADDATCESSEAKQQNPKLMPDGYPTICGSIAEIPWSRKPTETKYSMGIGGRNVPMSLLAAALTAPYTGDTGLDHAVIDGTGIAGNVDFTLQLGFDEIESTNTPDTAPLFAGELRDQLGMKLKADKGKINVYVVDHVEHLIEN